MFRPRPAPAPLRALRECQRALHLRRACPPARPKRPPAARRARSAKEPGTCSTGGETSGASAHGGRRSATASVRGTGSVPDGFQRQAPPAGVQPPGCTLHPCHASCCSGRPAWRWSVPRGGKGRGDSAMPRKSLLKRIQLLARTNRKGHVQSLRRAKQPKSKRGWRPEWRRRAPGRQQAGQGALASPSCAPGRPVSSSEQSAPSSPKNSWLSAQMRR
jgi:hypothetical protein